MIRQLTWFALVGTTAAMVQLSILTLLVENFHLAPLIGNIVGFLVAFNVSYFGHRYLSFRGTRIDHHKALQRFLFVAGTNFFANQLLFAFFLNYCYLPYFIASLLVQIILPVSSFLLNKRWVFSR